MTLEISYYYGDIVYSCNIRHIPLLVLRRREKISHPSSAGIHSQEQVTQVLLYQIEYLQSTDTQYGPYHNADRFASVHAAMHARLMSVAVQVAHAV